MRVLVLFMSPGTTRAESNTYTCLQTLIKKEVGDDVFVDNCYCPCAEDFELLANNKFPVVFGNVSHRPIQDYDLICVSLSVVPESLNVPKVFVNSGIPLSHEDRLKRNDIPLILIGGMASSICHWLYGEISEEDGGGHSMIDMGSFGFGEFVLEYIIEHLRDMNKIKPIKSDKENVITSLLAKPELNIFYPTGYDYETEPENPFIVKSIAPNRPDVPQKTSMGNSYRDDFPGFVNKVFTLDGQNCTSTDVLISHGCSGEGTCSFCHEGTISGPFREKPLEALTKDLITSKKNSAANTIGLYSYNLNYYSKLFDLLGNAGSIFSKISLIQMRTDEIGNNPEFLTLTKHLGQIRTSMAIEGMGNRVRNSVLNKNLDRETIMKAAKNVFKQKFLLLKIVIVVTGQETAEDIAEWISEVDEMLAIREECGAKTGIMLTHTPLVIYDQIPLRHLQRITAENSFNHVKNMSDYLTEMFNRGIMTKFHAKGSGTFIEQLMLDSGRTGTKPFVHACLHSELDYSRFFNDVVKKKDYRCF